MHLLLFSLLVSAAPPVGRLPGGDRFTDTTRLTLALSPPIMRFSQSSDLCALLAGEGEAGFGANPAVLGWAGPNALSYTGHYASRMPDLNLPDLREYSQSAAWTGFGGPGLRLGAGAGMRSMALGTGRSATEYSLAIGRRMDASGNVLQDLGVSLKTVIPEGIRAPDGTEASPGLLADIGYLATFGGFLRAGATLENLGKGVTGVRPELNLLSGEGSRAVALSDSPDPEFSLTPLTLTLGVALFRSWDAGAFHLIDVSLAGSWAKSPWEGPGDQSFATAVVGVALLRSLGGEWGILRDPSAAEAQGKFGLSLSLFNHVRFGFAMIGATGGRELYDGQKGFSLALSNLSRWTRGDWSWWRR